MSQYSSLLLGALNKDMQKCDPCLSDWKCEEDTGTFIPLWYDCNQLPQQISKCRRPSANKRAQTQKTAVTDNDRPKRLNVAVAKKIGSCRTLILIMKITLIPVIVCKIFAVKVIVLIQIFTLEAAPRKYYFFRQF